MDQNTKIKLAQEGNQFCMEELINDNTGMVLEICKKYCSLEFLEFDDLKQEGLIALWKSILDFDFSREIRFSTYAWARIRGSMLNFVRKEAKHIHENIDDFILKDDINFIRDINDSLDFKFLIDDMKRTLSEEELKIVALLVDGKSKKKTAKILNMSEYMLYKNIKSIQNKLRGIM